MKIAKPQKKTLTVPKEMQAAHDAVVALTDAFCAEHLDTEYRDLARRMALALSRKRPSPLGSGQPRTWACGIIHVLGQVNFLTDPATKPTMTTAEVCKGFATGQSTASAKGRVIYEVLGVNRMDPTWLLPAMVEANPLLWMAEVNGILVDLRDMPREVQEIALAQGLIPYIPGDDA